ncbi:DNA helicase UvrD [Candidatus Woesearchaeota archaeon]|nr:DNA helicase UvrD [Candidatus Woesearchaeota archaeon]
MAVHTTPLFADFHIHSKYARACSKDLDLAHLEQYARMKGVDILGTGDFLHPQWQAELKKHLHDNGTGILRSQSGFPFILQTELSFMYSDGGKGRRVHLLVLAKSMEVVDQITEAMKKHGRVDYDGRPVFGMTCPAFVEEMMQIDRDIEIIPAHIWTPWFSLFGSNSGFDSVKDCFKDQANHIHALETGLSSDPPMNWRLSQLDKYQIVSFSDSHSFWPWRMGREATLFDIDQKKLSYAAFLSSLRTGDRLAGTVEVNPNYGKYHLDGHRSCKVCFTPEESRKHKNICPVCRKPLTIGVLNRVEELADRPEGFVRPDAPLFHSMIPLSELLAAALGKTVASKPVWAEYSKITEPIGPEFDVLLRAPEEQLVAAAGEKITGLILQNRKGLLHVTGGFDGEYGKLAIPGQELVHQQKQRSSKKTREAAPTASSMPQHTPVKRSQRGLEEWQ